MKTKKYLMVILLMTATLPAQARMIESANSVNYTYQGAKPEPANYEPSLWEKLQTAAKKQVSTWRAALDKKIAELKAPPASDEGGAARGIASVPTTSDTEKVAGAVAGAAVGSALSGTQAGPSLTVEQKELSQIIQSTKAEVSKLDVVQNAKEGRPADASLQKTKVGVPVFSLSKTEVKKSKSGKTTRIKIVVKDIPRLDVGLERSISTSELVAINNTVPLKLRQKIKPLESPALYSQKEIIKLSKKKWPHVESAKPPKRDGYELGQIVTHQKIEAVPIDMVVTKPIEALRPFKEFSKDELKMLAAAIIFEKGNKCHLAVGLLTDLADKKQYAEESNFFLGVCAHQMGFHTEAVSRLLKVIQSGNSEFDKEAIKNLAEDLPREYDIKVAKTFKNIKTNLDDKTRDNVNFILSRAAHAEGNYSEAVNYAQKVSDKSEHYAQARYLYAIGLYGLKKLKEAEGALVALRDWMTSKNKTDKNLTALITLNLARMHFTQGQYQSANAEYLKMPKDHPLWVQALIEQGWVQLNIDDPEGAVGNMYSLHSPYFKSVFMPESWVVRTIGYINICQYGDAYKTLTRLEQLHSGWQAMINKYLSSNKDPANYYGTVRSYLKGRSDQNVNGLPYQVIREIARQRGFLNAQGALNTIEDEIAQYSFIYGLVRKDQNDTANRLTQTKVRLAKVKADLLKIKTTPELAKNMNQWLGQKRNEEQLVKYYEFQSDVYEQSRKGFLKMKTVAMANINHDKNRLRTQAGKALMSHLKDVSTRIAQIIEGNEFLRYEIFSGSGENIRFQVSGGKVGDTKRVPANVKPQKMLNWEFDGEYWEDEIGSYRSSLKNNCPKNARTALSSGQDGKSTH